MTTTMYSTATLTDRQEPPSASRRAALAILALKTDDDVSDDAFAKRVGLTSGKQQVNAMRAGGGVSLDVAFAVAKKMRMSLDEMLGLDGERLPPSLLSPVERDLEMVTRELQVIRERLAELRATTSDAELERKAMEETPGQEPPEPGEAEPGVA